MIKLYNEEKRKPAFKKIKNYRLIMQFMKDVIDEKSVEKENLEDIQDNLKSKI